MEDEADTSGVKPSDREAVRRLASVFANRMYVRVEGGNVRLNFAELVEGEALYHTAITLSAVDAVLFGDLMVRVASTAIPASPESESPPLAPAPLPGVTETRHG